MTSLPTSPHNVTKLTDEFQKLFISTHATRTPELPAEQLPSEHQIIKANKRKLRGRRRHAQWRRRRQYKNATPNTCAELYPHLEDLTITDDDIL